VYMCISLVIFTTDEQQFQQRGRRFRPYDNNAHIPCSVVLSVCIVCVVCLHRLRSVVHISSTSNTCNFSAHTRPGRGGRQKTVRKRTKSALVSYHQHVWDLRYVTRLYKYGTLFMMYTRQYCLLQ